MNYFYIYLILINLISSFMTLYDKHASKTKKQRVPEKSLLLFSILGGSPFMLFTMLNIKHKTRHLKFMAGIPFILILQIGIFILLKYYVFR